MKVTPTMVLFYGGVFSQWYLHSMTIDGVIYNTAEQYMMARKAEYFEDMQTLEKIMSTDNPQDQKAYGRLVSNFNKEAWDAVSRGFVYKANMEKFSDPKLKSFILETGDRLIVEASEYDKIWGIGLAVYDPRAEDPSLWRGTNWLGEVLMKVRNDLKTKEL